MRQCDIIIKPLVTEKTTEEQGVNKYHFAVVKGATKFQVRAAVESLFNVKVASVNTTIMPGKYVRVGRNTGKKPDWKKAIVTLREGTIAISEGA